MISINNGTTYQTADEISNEAIDQHWDEIVNLMDDDIREQVHGELVPCSNRDFLRRYLELAGDLAI